MFPCGFSKLDTRSSSLLKKEHLPRVDVFSFVLCACTPLSHFWLLLINAFTICRGWRKAAWSHDFVPPADRLAPYITFELNIPARCRTPCLFFPLNLGCGREPPTLLLPKCLLMHFFLPDLMCTILTNRLNLI